MRAVWLKEFGGPEVLVAADTPDPVAGPGQVLIEVAFANITFVETQLRAMRSLAERALAEAAAGRLRPVIGQRFPLERPAEAHEAIQSRATVGKTLLEVR
jgi:NADPH:quinone reductase-like Zn-dependent oxidoreductase